METDVVGLARSWIGTPYVHQASLKHAGCDCLGLLRGIWRELYGEEPEETPPYSLDWAEATGAETLYMALKRHAHEIRTERLAPGDIALFRVGAHGPAKHCGIVASISPRPHAVPPPQSGGGGPPKAVEGAHANAPFVSLRFACSTPPPLRRGGTFAAGPPRVGGGESLTLIHARQNKRVSEEPFSAFWRGKLAFAFRI